MFQRDVVEKIKPHILGSITFFLKKIVPLMNNVENYCRGEQAAYENMGHAHCMLDT